MRAMVSCAQCLFDNPDAATSCEQCGAELKLEVLSLQLGEVCRSCDSYNDPGVRVCVSCGKPLGLVAAPDDDLEAPPEKPEKTAPAAPAEHLLAPTPQPWMAPPDTGEYVKTKDKPVTPAPLPGIAASAARPGGSGALPPGWGGGTAKTAVAKTSKDAVNCPKCQAPNPPTARYCGTCGFGLTPAGAKAKGKLILIRGISGEGRQFQLGATPSTVGRSGAIAFPEDPYVGQLHGTFSFRGDDLIVKDEGAGNGIYVRLREPQALRPGDMFSIGEHLLRYNGISAAPPVPVARHGSPRTSDRLQVIEEVLEGGTIGRVCKRPGPTVTIGRVGCDLSFAGDGFISAKHAELTLSGETAFLRDLSSANGTFLRVQPHADKVLKHGDYLLLGRELLRVEVSATR
jgi:ribosomal protein L40E